VELKRGEARKNFQKRLTPPFFDHSYLVPGGNPPRWLLDVGAPRLDMARADKGSGMLYYALIFLVIALLAGAVGFLALAGLAALIARVMFVLFLVLFLVSLVRRRRL
jgi:uncharacterized membrane protein YtjA (UPF0391 family)